MAIITGTPGDLLFGEDRERYDHPGVQAMTGFSLILATTWFAAAPAMSIFSERKVIDLTALGPLEFLAGEGTAFSGTGSGEVRFFHNAGNTTFEVDVNGDGTADMANAIAREIDLTGANLILA